MVRSLGETARLRGWDAELGFSSVAERHLWYEPLRTGFEGSVFIVPAANRRRTSRWLAQRVGTSAAPTILHTHFTRFDLPAVWVAARRPPPTAVFWHLHTPLHENLRARARNTVKFGLLGRRVDGILAAGHDPAAAVIRVGAPRDRVEVVGGAIELDRFTPPSAEERIRSREQLSIPLEETVLLHFSWDWHYKDGDLFLAAIRALLERVPREGDRILGLTVGPDRTGRDAVERFTPGGAVRAIARVEDVRTLYRAADVLVSSSRVEGQPFAVIEAICSGLPVAATDLPGHRDICEGLESCRIASRSPEALATAIDELLHRSPTDAAVAGTEARRSMVSRFDLDAWSEQMIGRYEAALGPKRDRLGAT